MAAPYTRCDLGIAVAWKRELDAYSWGWLLSKPVVEGYHARGYVFIDVMKTPTPLHLDDAREFLIALEAAIAEGEQLEMDYRHAPKE